MFFKSRAKGKNCLHPVVLNEVFLNGSIGYNAQQYFCYYHIQL